MKDITLDELKAMRKHEGLIIQGCGGDPQEWIDGIQDLLTTEEILLDGDTFKDVFRFENEGITCPLRPRCCRGQDSLPILTAC